MIHITALAREFGLSRTALLYYDRIKLLSPSGRTHANYRFYTEADRERLRNICLFRRAGLGLADIKRLLQEEDDESARILKARLHSLSEEICALQAQQHMIADMLRVKAAGWQGALMNKTVWTEMLRKAGLSDAATDLWHREFERRAPEAHRNFLASLGISAEEIATIRVRISASVAGK